MNKLPAIRTRICQVPIIVLVTASVFVALISARHGTTNNAGEPLMEYAGSGAKHLPGIRSLHYQPIADVVEQRINIPYLGASAEGGHLFEPAVFWFGQVTPTQNYADVRLWYYDDFMEVMLNIVDRRLWYNPDPSATPLEEMDAATLFFNLNGKSAEAPTPSSYRLVAQLNWWEADGDYQLAYRGDGTGWVETPLQFTTKTGWRGDAPNNDSDDRGWQVTFTIPFRSLGLSGHPGQGTKWGLAVAVHDRDDAAGSSPNVDQVWPESAAYEVPWTWGEIHFSIPVYDPPLATKQGSTTIRQGLNGADVVDGHVGGHSVCGNGLDYWIAWGQMNYAGYEQINIQNQWDIADYPCFSKYFVTFPLDALPSGKTILAASLLMTRFGNAGGGQSGEPPDSFIQALTVAEAWDEQTLTWNSAPLALENIGGTWVQPVQTSEQLTYEWDVSRAAARAYQAGEPLRLALYSGDGPNHSGKYFWSSDSANRDPEQRPTLRVTWGVPCDASDVECHINYLPAVSH